MHSIPANADERANLQRWMHALTATIRILRMSAVRLRICLLNQNSEVLDSSAAADGPCQDLIHHETLIMDTVILGMRHPVLYQLQILTSKLKVASYWLDLSKKLSFSC